MNSLGEVILHFHCVGLDEAGEPSDSDWICLTCNIDVDAMSTDDDCISTI